jgi:hypothetical protein
MKVPKEAMLVYLVKQRNINGQSAAHYMGNIARRVNYKFW